MYYGFKVIAYYNNEPTINTGVVTGGSMPDALKNLLEINFNEEEVETVELTYISDSSVLYVSEQTINYLKEENNI